MSETGQDKPVTSFARALCLAWVLTVSLVFCVSYGACLLLFARESASRFPLVSSVLDLFRLRP